MKCPFCGYSESKVIDSRPADEGASIRRRRECLSCQKRFTTYEMVESLPMSNVVEVKARGAEVLALTTEGFREKMGKTADSTIAVPLTHPVLQPSLGVAALQLFAYYVALQRGCDIDKPRNLAKSVTVE